jgi:hypothetical protein
LLAIRGGRIRSSKGKSAFHSWSICRWVPHGAC